MRRTERQEGPASVIDIRPAAVARMSVRTLAASGLLVYVRSDVLRCRVAFCADNVPPQAIRDVVVPVYRAGELRELSKLLNPETLEVNEDGLRAVHALKEVMGGHVDTVEPRKSIEGRQTLLT